MKIPTRKASLNSAAFNVFVNAADSNTTLSGVVNTPKMREGYKRTTLQYTDKQKKLFDDFRKTMNISINLIMRELIEFSKQVPLNHLDYSSFIPLFKEKGWSNTTYCYADESHAKIKEKTMELKNSWINIPFKSVLLMYMLHYLKNKLGVDIDQYL